MSQRRGRRHYLALACMAVAVGCAPHELIGIDEIDQDAGIGAAGDANSATPPTQVLGQDCTLVRTDEAGSDQGEVVPVCCPLSASDRAYTDEMLLVINQARSDAGVASASRDEALDMMAQARALHWAIHDSTAIPESALASPSDRAVLCATTAETELFTNNPNWDASNPDPASSFAQALLGVAASQALLLDPTYQRMGIGYFEGRVAIAFGL